MPNRGCPRLEFTGLRLGRRPRRSTARAPRALAYDTRGASRLEATSSRRTSSDGETARFRARRRLALCRRPAERATPRRGSRTAEKDPARIKKRAKRSLDRRRRREDFFLHPRRSRLIRRPKRSRTRRGAFHESLPCPAPRRKTDARLV